MCVCVGGEGWCMVHVCCTLWCHRTFERLIECVQRLHREMWGVDRRYESLHYDVLHQFARSDTIRRGFNRKFWCARGALRAKPARKRTLKSRFFSDVCAAGELNTIQTLVAPAPSTHPHKRSHTLQNFARLCEPHPKISRFFNSDLSTKVQLSKF